MPLSLFFGHSLTLGIDVSDVIWTFSVERDSLSIIFIRFHCFIDVDMNLVCVRARVTETEQLIVYNVAWNYRI